MPIILDNFHILLRDRNHWQSPHTLSSHLTAYFNDMRKKTGISMERNRIREYVYTKMQNEMSNLSHSNVVLNRFKAVSIALLEKKKTH